jgi:hypothetical protein
VLGIDSVLDFGVLLDGIPVAGMNPPRLIDIESLNPYLTELVLIREDLRLDYLLNFPNFMNYDAF